jgi:hypothetical protein
MNVIIIETESGKSFLKTDYTQNIELTNVIDYFI